MDGYGTQVTFIPIDPAVLAGLKHSLRLAEARAEQAEAALRDLTRSHDAAMVEAAGVVLRLQSQMNHFVSEVSRLSLLAVGRLRERDKAVQLLQNILNAINVPEGCQPAPWQFEASDKAITAALEYLSNLSATLPT
jgi:hypothetical protein